MSWIWHCKSRGTDERGASAVEFALIAPLFFMIVFGMFTGGLLFNEKSQLTFAAREAARYGSTLPLVQTFTDSGSLNADTASDCVVSTSAGATATGPLWACNVAKAAISAAGGDLNSAISGRFICVAAVQDLTTVLTDSSGNPYHYTIGTTPSPAPPSDCFDDGGADTAQRVHVLVERNGSLNAVLFNMRMTLTSSGVGRIEKAPPSGS